MRQARYYISKDITMATSSLNAPVITDEYARQELESLTEDERRRLHEDLYGEQCTTSSSDSSNSSGDHDVGKAAANLNAADGTTPGGTMSPPTTTYVPVKTQDRTCEETTGPRKALTRSTPSTRTMTSSSSISSVSDGEAEELEEEEGDHSGRSSDDITAAVAGVGPAAVTSSMTTTMTRVEEGEGGTPRRTTTSSPPKQDEEDDDDDQEEAMEGGGDDDGNKSTGIGNKYFQFNLPSTLVTGVAETFRSEEALSLAVQAMIDGTGTGTGNDVNTTTECTVFSDRDKRDYLEAKEKCPHVVQKESDPIYFLRCEDYNIKVRNERKMIVSSKFCGIRNQFH